MNILHVRASNFYGGPERQLHYHAREGLGSKYGITVASFTEGGKTPEFLNVIAGDGIRTHVFEVTSAYDTRAVSAIRGYLLKNNISILCTHDYRSAAIGFLAVRKCRTRWIAFSRGFTRDNLKVRLYHAIDKFLIRQANHIVAVSQAQKEKLQRLFIREKNISVVLNAIDPGGFADVQPVDLYNRFNLDEDSIVCISGGRFSREKGQMCLAEAAVEALRTNPKLRFILFGDGPDLEKVRTAVHKSGCQGKIVCPGFEKDLIACLKGADMLINPSRSEGLPNIILEAMALNTVVVATAVGGVPEVITDNETGFLAPAGDCAGLSAAIIKAADRMADRVKITAAALERVTTAHSFADQFDKLSVLYDRIGS